MFESNGDVVKRCDVLVLAVKPQNMSAVLAELEAVITAEHLVVSIAAGITIESMARGLSRCSRLIRVMPNTPALVGEGVSAFAAGSGARAEDAALVEAFLGSVGRAVRVSESMLDAVTGLSGSGPAFVCLVIEALSDGGVRAGLPRDVASLLAVQTVLGAARTGARHGGPSGGAQRPGRITGGHDDRWLAGARAVRSARGVHRGGRSGGPSVDRAGVSGCSGRARQIPQRDPPMKLGVISDIHGDPVGLELAWSHLTVMGAQQIVAAGDLAGYGPFPDRVVAFLQEHNIPSVARQSRPVGS